MSVGIELVFLLFLILINGVFALSEIAVISAHKARLRQRADEGNRGAEIALQLANAPNQFLATIQIGITLVGIFAGAFGGATLAEKLSVWLTQVPVLAPYSKAVGVGAVVLGTTYLSLVVGELLPKRLAMGNPEQLASAVAPAMRTMSRLTAPVVRLLSFSTDLLVRLLGVREQGDVPASEEEINLLLKHGVDVGVFDRREQELVARTFRLDDLTAGALMTPRPEVVWIDADDSPDKMLLLVATGGRSRYPIAVEDLDQVRGIVYTKDLLAQCLDNQPFDPDAVLRPAVFVPETLSVLDTIERLREAHVDIAMVIDEYSSVQGILTVDDVLKAFVGRIPSAGEVPPRRSVLREDGSWLLDGLLTVEELKDVLELKHLPEEERARYQTLGGLAMLCLGHIPAAGEEYTWSGWHFTVVKMDGHRVQRVLAEPLKGTKDRADCL